MRQTLDADDSSAHFMVKIALHSEDAKKALYPEMVRELIAEALERQGNYKVELFEEVDFTLEVSRFYDVEETVPGSSNAPRG